MLSNGKKIRKNLFWGLLSEAVTIILGILVPRFILTSYGSEINGLLSSVTQIYSYIGLIEAGIGIATVQALYKTVGVSNNKKSNSILSATNHYYHRTGIIYVLAIIAFSILYPFIVQSEIPSITVVLIIVFNGVGSVLNFFFHGKYILLLQAEGKNYIQTSLSMVTNIIKQIAKIVLMATGFDVVYVQAISILVSLIQMVYLTIYIKKHYDWIDLKESPDYESISQSKNVLVHQITGLIFYNTDAITLSIFCGLKIVSIYSMYTLLFGMISTALSTITSSVVFSLGQMFHKDKTTFIKMYDAFEMIYLTLVFALYSIANYFILPFMKLYTNGVNDINYIDNLLPLMFISTYLLSSGRIASTHVISFAGHFKETQNRAVLEAIINIVVSIIAVQFLGIYGVLIGTIAALLYRANDIVLYSAHMILHRKAIITYKRWGINLVVFLIILVINSYLNIQMNSYIDIFIFLIPYSIATIVIFFTISALCERDTASYVFQLICSKIKHIKVGDN
ncbi:sugar isomerase [Clostridiales bacterium FE2010]|nr:sugar isomerase [Clostridiales bacterium FE2010]